MIEKSPYVPPEHEQHEDPEDYVHYLMQGSNVIAQWLEEKDQMIQQEQEDIEYQLRNAQ